MANVNVACSPELVVHLRATDDAGLRGIGGTAKLEEIGFHPLWGDVVIDIRQPYNILSLHQAQVHGFLELTCMQVKLSNTSVKCIPLGSKTCIVRADFITPLIFRPLISSSKLRRQSDFIRRLIIHLTKRSQPCLCHHPPSTSRLFPWVSRTLVLSIVCVLTVLKASRSRQKVLISLLLIR
jgi:hypothetical protein